jgi:hypothetical protein
MQFEEDAQGAAKLFEEERTLLIAEKEQLQARIDRLVNKLKEFSPTVLTFLNVSLNSPEGGITLWRRAGFLSLLGNNHTTC